MAESQSIGGQETPLLTKLHHSTRVEHASLNKTIVSRLPLCLPPNAPDLYFYAAGMTVFGHIYTALEGAWDRILEEQGNDHASAKWELKHIEILSNLRTQHLPRARCLESDLLNLKHELGAKATTNLEELQSQSHHFQVLIKERISENPHLVLAYAWPMYLALFNGGRWIVNQVLTASASHWPNTEAQQIADSFLSFWFFDDSMRDANHGETVKIDFKQRFNYASSLLSDADQEEIIHEAKHVFGICAEMITILDNHALAMATEQQRGFLADSSTAGEHQSGARYPMTSVLPLRRVWQSLGSIMGYITPPTALRKDFEQHT